MTAPAPQPLHEPRVQTPLGSAPVIPVLLLIGGAYLAWFGVHYWRTDVASPADPVKAILQGKPIPAATKPDPTNVANAVGIVSGAIHTDSGPTGGGSGGGTLTGPNPQIAAAALKYVGAGYNFGGRAERIGDWDCSSFLSYVLGHDLGLVLPGGGHYGATGYPPHAHGPTAAAYKLYGTGINRQQLGAGDIVAWNTHCGIAVDSSRIVSARTPSEGTGISNIDSTSSGLGETPVFRRAPSPIGQVINV